MYNDIDCIGENIRNAYLHPARIIEPRIRLEKRVVRSLGGLGRIFAANLGRPLISRSHHDAVSIRGLTN